MKGLKTRSIQAYLNRIRYFHEPAVSIRCLQDLVYAHLSTVPFENLDIHNKTPIELDYEKLFKKIVTGNRGGFCYELNGIFYLLLKSIGFDSSMLSARVFRKDGSLSPEYDHLTLLVNVGGEKFITDVGFGEFAIKPLPLRFDKNFYDGRKHFKFMYEENGRFSLYSLSHNTWTGEFNFDIKKREFKEFSEMCRFHQTDPESHFMKKPICTILTEDGRVTLAGNALRIRSGINEVNTEVDDDLISIMRKRYFGIG